MSHERAIPGVSFSENGLVQPPGLFRFFSVAGGGGFNTLTGTGTLILNEFGPQLYMGSESAPTFLPGTYELSGEGTLTTGLTGTLNITSTAAGDVFNYSLSTPEPGSLLLLGSGLVLLGFARKKIVSNV
jgi:hypothetical protein